MMMMTGFNPSGFSTARRLGQINYLLNCRHSSISSSTICCTFFTREQPVTFQSLTRVSSNECASASKYYFRGAGSSNNNTNNNGSHLGIGIPPCRSRTSNSYNQIIMCRQQWQLFRISTNNNIINNNHRYHYFSTTTSEESTPFDRNLKDKQRTRAAEKARQYYNQIYQQTTATSATKSNRKKPITVPYDYFHREVASRLVERLDDIQLHEEGFPLALEIGATANLIYDAIVEGCGDETDDLLKLDNKDDENIVYVGGRGGIRKLVQMDSCSAMIHRDDVFAEYEQNNNRSGEFNSNKNNNDTTVCETYKLVSDFDGGGGGGNGVGRSNPLPFPDATFDLVISSMALHWVNNLPKLLSEIERVLKPDGCLLFALPGGNTLPELRSSLVLSELERTGGVSTHVGPYVDLSNVGSLLTGTGFRLPTIDIDDIQIGYPNAMVLMEHLGRMGEGNACTNRKERIGLGTFLGAACLYRELYPMKDAEEERSSDGGGNEEDGIVASAQVIYGIAWKEHSSQQKPEVRGSATHKLTDIAVTKTSTNHD